MFDEKKCSDEDNSNNPKSVLLIKEYLGFKSEGKQGKFEPSLGCETLPKKLSIS